MKGEADLLWTPRPEFVDNSNLTQFMNFLRSTRDLNFNDYAELWEWSVLNTGDFWESIVEYFDVDHDGTWDEPVSVDPMPHTKWFEGISLNYAEHVFRNASDHDPAIIFKNEQGQKRNVSWSELKEQTGKLSNYLRSRNIGPGDAVVGYLPTIPEASIGFLAACAMGATWSSTSPDFGVPSVIDRFGQLEPKVLICATGYCYNGKVYNKKEDIEKLLAGLPTVEEVIVIQYPDPSLDITIPHTAWDRIMNEGTAGLHFERVAFSHPMWVLYSSGTTGVPKAMTQSQGGILLEHFKYLSLHNNIKPGDRCFWYTTTGWMMWNYIQSSWLCGGTVILYDGSPAWPDIGALWRLAEDVSMTHFGTSAGFIVANMRSGIKPGTDHDLTSLVSIGSTGSPLPPEGFKWLYENVKKDLWVASISGGSDVCSAFVGGNPTWPVYRGEIQCRALGCNLEAWDEVGNALWDEVGEMVITKPMPSMPVFFWNDKDYERYTESYFSMYPGIWRHGDWTRITPRQGIVIYGRSDSTLNRGGVRIGTSEIYRAVDKIPEIADSIIICIEREDGKFYMPLFVKMKGSEELDEGIAQKIRSTIRTDYSPRHVPDEIIAVPDIPYTISGKKVETPVKKILSGRDLEKSLNKDALRNPESLEFFIEFAKLAH